MNPPCAVKKICLQSFFCLSQGFTPDWNVFPILHMKTSELIIYIFHKSKIDGKAFMRMEKRLFLQLRQEVLELFINFYHLSALQTDKNQSCLLFQIENTGNPYFAIFPFF